MYNLSLPNLCALLKPYGSETSYCCSLASATVNPCKCKCQCQCQCAHTVLCGALYTACVDASTTVFWDRSTLCCMSVHVIPCEFIHIVFLKDLLLVYLRTIFLQASIYGRLYIRNRSTPYLQCICTACNTSCCKCRHTISHLRASTRSLRFLLGRTVLRLPSSRSQRPIHRSIHILHLSDQKN